MKIPMPPPPTEDLLVEMARDPGLFVQIAAKMEPSGATADYLPWDKLRFKTPPNGLTHRQWWFTLKLARRGMQRTLPLVDANGNPFT